MRDPASLQKEIYERRHACGKRLQPTYAGFLEMFNCVLTKQLKHPHPYKLSDDDISCLGKQTKVFSLGGIGDEATLSGGKHIYRVFKKGHLELKLDFKWPGHKNPVKLWDHLMAKSKRGKLWLNLENYAASSYPKDIVDKWFNCTWWTPFPLDEDVILGAYTIGLFSESISEEVYIMRALIEEVNALKVTHVPTVIDGLMQPVFRPTQEPLQPTGGITINLSVYQNPSQGVSEFCIKPLDAKLIEIKPVRIDLDKQLGYQKISQTDPVVLESLLSYYDAL